MITNRGAKVWPGGASETFLTDHWRCRYMVQEGGDAHKEIVALLDRLNSAGFDFIQIQNLCTFDGEKGYSVLQGQ
jgi:isocitrate dehydrogenase